MNKVEIQSLVAHTIIKSFMRNDKKLEFLQCSDSNFWINVKQAMIWTSKSLEFHVERRKIGTKISNPFWNCSLNFRVADNFAIMFTESTKTDISKEILTQSEICTGMWSGSIQFSSLRIWDSKWTMKKKDFWTVKFPIFCEIICRAKVAWFQ